MAKSHASVTLILGVAWFLTWLVAAAFILPVAAVVLVLSGLYFIVRAGIRLPAVQQYAARRRVEQRRLQVADLQNSLGPPDPESFATAVAARCVELGILRDSALGLRLRELARALYVSEQLYAPVPRPPASASAFDLAVYEDTLQTFASRIAAPAVVATLEATIARLGTLLTRQLPRPLWREASTCPLATGQHSVRLWDLLGDVRQTVEAMRKCLDAEAAVEAELFREARRRLEENRYVMSGLPFEPDRVDPRKLVDPTEHKGDAHEIVEGYLRGTPLLALLSAPVPFAVPKSARFEHQWVLAGSGHGKTQALQCQIAADLEQVAAGAASLIVIDSQGELINNVAHLKLFAPGQPLHGRLCLIDPTDIAFPVALNLFDAGLSRLDQYSQLDRERLMNGAIELYDFILTSLLSAELTQKQSVVFRYITRLLLEIPDATIHTFRELMEPRGYAKYRRYIDRLDGTARAFFETEFNSKQFEDTKRQVVRRLWGVLENRTFERMFTHPKSRLDIFAEMNAGKVILINTAADLLKKNGTEIFGRFFIAMIAQAAQERATLPKEQRLPVYVYIDEAEEYFDNNVALILEQMRKFNVGLVLAHQYIGQLTPKLFDSFAANTSIKFAGGVSDKDARSMAHMMRCSPEFIDAQPKASFAAFVRNMTPRAVTFQIELGLMERMPQMSKREFEVVREEMRAKYATPWTEVRVERNSPGDPPASPHVSDQAGEW